MHIADGVLTTSVWVGGYITAAGVCAACSRGIKAEDMPKAAVMTSALFVVSLIHIPLGPTSVHLLLNGIAGIVLGPLSFIAILLSLILQAVLFQHGGLTTIGVNSLIVGVPALVCYRLFLLRNKIKFRNREVIFGAICGALGPALAALLLSFFLIVSGGCFIGIAKVALIANLPIVIIEGVLTGFIVAFLYKVKPEMLGGFC